jgi:hypothetical protein
LSWSAIAFLALETETVWTIVLEFRFARGNLDALPSLARELVGLPVDIIVTDSTAGGAPATSGSATAVFSGAYSSVSSKHASRQAWSAEKASRSTRA